MSAVDGDGSEQRAPRVAVVIGSGSVKCAAALGLQRVLKRRGIDIDMLVGCSGGALYATTMALGYDAEEIVRATLQFWTHEATHKRDRLALLRVVMPRLFGFTKRWGLRDDTIVVERLRGFFGDRTFADAKIPLYLTATDFDTGEQVVLEEGRLVDAIRASIAIPFVFRPWPVGDRLLVDGYVSDPLPVSVAIRESADVILALGFQIPLQPDVDTATRYAFQVGSLMTRNLLTAKFGFHSLAAHAEILAITPDFGKRIGLFDTDKIPYVIEEGERAAEQQMPYLERLLASRRSGAAGGGGPDGRQASP